MSIALHINLSNCCALRFRYCFYVSSGVINDMEINSNSAIFNSAIGAGIALQVAITRADLAHELARTRRGVLA